MPEKSNMFGQCIFVAHAWGGGGGKESSCYINVNKLWLKMYMIEVQGVGEPFMLLSNVLDTKGEGVGG